MEKKTSFGFLEDKIPTLPDNITDPWEIQKALTMKHRRLTPEEESIVTQMVWQANNYLPAFLLKSIDPNLSKTQQEENFSFATDLYNAGNHAKETMLRFNQRWVLTLAKDKRYRVMNNNPVCLSEADLVSAGNIGLLRAIEKFDPYRGNRFTTYATSWINQSIDRQIFNEGDTIRLPIDAHRQRGRLRTALTALKAATNGSNTNGHSKLTPQEISDYVNSVASPSDSKISPQRVEELQRLPSVKMSLDAPLKHDNRLFLTDILAGDSDTYKEAIDNISRSQYSEITRILESVLDSREYAILRLRFMGDNRPTFDDVGRDFGISRERVRQIENRAFRKLRKPEIKELLKPYY